MHVDGQTKGVVTASSSTLETKNTGRTCSGALGGTGRQPTRSRIGQMSISTMTWKVTSARPIKFAGISRRLCGTPL